VPTPEEIEALCSGRTLNTIVFFLDETFEELLYDITTTVLEVRRERTHARPVF
jgi:aspartate/methionine/tyrosine aminotransferase